MTSAMFIASLADYLVTSAVLAVPCLVSDAALFIHRTHTTKGTNMSDLYDPATSYSTDVLLDGPEDYYENMLPGEVPDISEYDVLDFDPYQDWSDAELAYYATDDELSELLWPGTDYDADAPF